MRVSLKPSSRWVLAGLLAAAGGCSLLGPGFSAWLRGLVGPVLAPLGEGGMYLTTTIERRTERLGQRAVSPGEAQRLMESNAELERRLTAAEGEWARLLAQQQQMQRLYGAIPYGQWELIPARVVAVDSLPYGQTRLLNVGRSRGAAPGESVTTRRLLTDRSKRLPAGVAAIAASALAGRIVEAGPFTAQMQLVTDKGFELTCRVLRVIDPANPRRITVTEGDASEQVLSAANNVPIPVAARGDGDDGLIVSDVNAYHNVRPGDWVVTAGGDAFLPVRVVIGKVSEVIEDPQRRGLYVSLRVKPGAELDSLREVYVVVPATDAGGEGSP